MSLEEKLAELKAYYATTLIPKTEKLANTLARLRREQSSETLADAWSQAHTLKGTAGSYGFAEFGDCAQRLETSLRRHKLASTLPDKTDWEEIDAAIKALAQRAVLDGHD